MTQIVDLLDDVAGAPVSIGFENDITPFGDLWRAAQHRSEEWRARGLTDCTVAVVLDNSRDAVIALFAGWSADCTLVSLPGPSRGQSLRQYATQIIKAKDDLQISAILMPPGVAVAVPDELLVALPYTFEKEAFTGNRQSGRDATSALIQFSSGTTRNPTFTKLLHSSLIANIDAILDVVEPTHGDITTSWLPLSHDMGLIGMCLASLIGLGPAHANGGQVFVDPPESFIRDPGSWIRRASDRRASVTAIPAFALDMACRAERAVGASGLDLRRLRSCIVGAERLRADWFSTFDRTFATMGLSSRALRPAYGLAEAGLAVTMLPNDREWSSVPTDVGSVACSGPPLPGYDVKIDPSTSEVIIGGPSLPGGEQFNTGDVGALVDGELVVWGRRDDMVKVRGRKVFLSDLDDELVVIARDLDCRIATYLPSSDEHAGGVGLAVEPRRQLASVEAARTRTQLRRALAASFGLTPTEYLLLEPGTLPRTTSGKVRRQALALLSADGQTDVT